MHTSSLIWLLELERRLSDLTEAQVAGGLCICINIGPVSPWRSRYSKMILKGYDILHISVLEVRRGKIVAEQKISGEKVQRAVAR